LTPESVRRGKSAENKERCRALWSELRHPEYSALSVADVLEQEQSQMMPMPTPFDGYVEKPTVAD
jgi:hypothetical protein